MSDEVKFDDRTPEWYVILNGKDAAKRQEGAIIVGTDYPPNWFRRLMQRITLGFVWVKSKDYDLGE